RRRSMAHACRAPSRSNRGPIRSWSTPRPDRSPWSGIPRSSGGSCRSPSGVPRDRTPSAERVRRHHKIPAQLDTAAPPARLPGFTTNRGKECRVMKVRPLQDRVLVKRLEEDLEKTKGGLYIPDSAKEKPQQGKIMAVGKGKVNDDGKVTALDVKVGD